MKLLRTGVILNTEKFDACVAFCRDVFDLDVLFEESAGDFHDPDGNRIGIRDETTFRDQIET